MLAATLTVLRTFVGICTFQLAPQDIPRSSALLLVSTLCNVALSMTICWFESSFGYAMFKAVLESGMLFVLTFTLLSLMSYRRRLMQTMTALMGTEAVLGGVALLTMLLAPILPTPLALAVLYVNFVLNLLVIAHILRHALGTWFLVGLLFAMGYALVLKKFFLLADALIGVAPV